jgi:hypothetical protein
VLNETREAHGLQRLAVPPIAAQLGDGSSSAPRLAAASASAGFHRSRHDMMDTDDAMMDDGDGGEHEHHGKLDPAEAVETLFRRLGVATHQSHSHCAAHSAPPTADSFASSSPSASAFPSSASLRSHHSLLHSRHAVASSSSSSSSSGGFHRNDFVADDAFDEMIPAEPAPPIHYLLDQPRGDPRTATSCSILVERVCGRHGCDRGATTVTRGPRGYSRLGLRLTCECHLPSMRGVDTESSIRGPSTALVSS